MLSRVKRCLSFFDLLINTYKVAPRMSRLLLAKATREQVVCMTELVVNTLAENLPIPASTLSKLVKSKRVLRKIARVGRLALATNSPPVSRPEAGQHPASASSDRPRGKRPRKSVEERSADKERVQRVKSACVTHYKTLIEFLTLCRPHIESLLRGEPAEDDSDNEVQS